VSVTPIVHVVDDNLEMRDSLCKLLESVSIEAVAHASADAFLATYDDPRDRPAVMLLDVRMPGMSGMALLEHLRSHHPHLTVIMITGHGDIDMAVRAMKLGAVDFVTKPFAAQALLDRIQEALRRPAAEQSPEPEQPGEDASARLATLTRREREIFDRIVAGQANKLIAFELGISIRTVESHRANIMEKLNANGLVDLVLMSVALKGEPSD
jgi:FixJ family two-component response regulator